MNRVSVAAGLVAAFVTLTAAQADPLRVVSWNIANLAQGPGTELRGYTRTEADYDRLRSLIAGLAPDVIALQEIGSIPGARAVLGDEYVIQFETRCITNEKGCLEDADDIYNAIAYRKDLEGVVETFQIDSLAIPHTSECAGEEPRRVRGGVGVKLIRDGTAYWIPSLHLKASCKTNGDEDGEDQLDDCATQRVQFGLLIDWMKSLPGDDAVILAGDFNRQLLSGSDNIRRDVLLAYDPDLSIVPGPASARQCWSGFAFQDEAMEAEAAAKFPEIGAAGGNPQIFKPTSNRLIDFFVARNLPDGVPMASEQVMLGDGQRFENPSGYLSQCDGSPKKFPGGGVLTFAQAYPSDHCPIVLTVGE